MPHFRRGSGMARFHQKRETLWLASVDVMAFVALGGATVILDQVFTGAQVSSFAPFTITRTVGQLNIRSDQTGAAEQGTLGLGAMIVREPARAAGIASLPTPLSENVDDGWFVYQLGGWSGGPLEGSPIHTYNFDSRAQRKVQDGDAIVWTL